MSRGVVATVQDIADWMLGELEKDGYLWYRYAVRQVLGRFSHRFIFVDKHRQLVIDRDVLKEFERQIDGYAVWDGRRRQWRRVRSA